MSYKYALQKFITHPEAHPNEVISYDDEFVLIKDAFPKALYHWLLLPRDLSISKQHPLTSFKDPVFKQRAEKTIDAAIEKILTLLKVEHGIEETETHVKVGCHAVPSMNNLHVHIMTSDMCGERLKNRHHYSSFTTEFFVPFDELPLAVGDKRMNAEEMEKLASKGDLICHNCGRNFSNKFADLKRHIHQEYKMSYSK